VVDDDPIFKMVIKKTILKTNLFEQVLEFDDAEEAWNEISQRNLEQRTLPDVLFLDINMPRTDGWQFLNNFKALDPMVQRKIKIYLISSSVYHGDKDQAAGYPFLAGFLTKPIETNFLISVA